MTQNEMGRSKPGGLSGKWLVALIVGGGIVLAIIAAKFNRYRALPAEPTSQPARPDTPAMDD